jgi:hypothetical protein
VTQTCDTHVPYPPVAGFYSGRSATPQTHEYLMTMKAVRSRKCSESFLIYFFALMARHLRHLLQVHLHHPQRQFGLQNLFIEVQWIHGGELSLRVGVMDSRGKDLGYSL